LADGSVNSVRLAIEILRYLAEGNKRVTDVSDKLGISKSTAHRLLKTLKNCGMVSQNTLDRTYHLGKLFIQLAYPLISSHQRLIESTSKEMQHLRKLSGETIILYIKNGDEIVCVEELPSLHHIKYTFGKNNTMPWHVGAASKAILAQLEDVEVERILEGIQPVVYTPNTNTNKDRLREEIRNARVKGYVTSFGTYESGTAALSVPIRNYIVPAALSILGSKKVFGPKIPDMISKILQSASIISNKLAKEF